MYKKQKSLSHPATTLLIEHFLGSDISSLSIYGETYIKWEIAIYSASNKEL